MGMDSLAFRETTTSDVSNATASVSKIASAARDVFINSDQFASNSNSIFINSQLAKLQAQRIHLHQWTTIRTD